MWKNVGKKIINTFFPLMVGLVFKIQRKKMGQLSSEFIFKNSNAGFIKTYIFFIEVSFSLILGLKNTY